MPNNGDVVNWKDFENNDPAAQERIFLLGYFDNKAAEKHIFLFDFDTTDLLNQMSAKLY